MSWSLRFFQHSNIFPSEFGRFFSSEKKWHQKKALASQQMDDVGMCKFINWSPCIVFLPRFLGSRTVGSFGRFAEAWRPFAGPALRQIPSVRGSESLRWSCPQKNGTGNEGMLIDVTPKNWGCTRLMVSKNFFCFFFPWNFGEWSKCRELFCQGFSLLGLAAAWRDFWDLEVHAQNTPWHSGNGDKKPQKTWDFFDGAIFFVLLAMMGFSIFDFEKETEPSRWSKAALCAFFFGSPADASDT